MLSGRADVPRVVTCVSNVTCWPAGTLGDWTTTAPGPMPRMPASSSRQLVADDVVPWFVSEIVTVSPPSSATTFAICAGNGPMPEVSTRASTARTTMATATPAIAVPWAWLADGCRRPSGLQRSHIASSSGICVPHRTQPWVSAARAASSSAGAAGEGVDAVGVMATSHRCTERRSPA
jgi:hypothetical protein